MSDDLNGDGFIDINEANLVLGKILIPLDGDLSTQASGRRSYPLANLSGSYHYERVIAFNRFFDDLFIKDSDPSDLYVRLTPGEGFSFIGKTVLIQGVVDTVTLPSSVTSNNNYEAFKTLPVTCGVFKKIDTTRIGTTEDEEIPGPIADVVEGQDRPAPTEDETGTNTNTNGETTNETDSGDTPTHTGDHGGTELDPEI
jgi:hypothetical protein